MTLYIIALEGRATWSDGRDKQSICFGEELNQNPEYVEDVRQWLDDYASRWGVYDEEGEADDVDTAMEVAAVYQRLTNHAGWDDLVFALGARVHPYGSDSLS